MFVPSAFIRNKFTPPARLDVNAMRLPSRLQALAVSSATCEVRRSAKPPCDETFHRSPRQVKTTCPPSGLIDGMRGRSTLAFTLPFALRFGCASCAFCAARAGCAHPAIVSNINVSREQSPGSEVGIRTMYGDEIGGSNFLFSALARHRRDVFWLHLVFGRVDLIAQRFFDVQHL